jgi:hypothetical protein
VGVLQRRSPGAELTVCLRSRWPRTATRSMSGHTASPRIGRVHGSGRSAFSTWQTASWPAKENLGHSARHGGRFITVMPCSHSEDMFHEHLCPSLEAIPCKRRYDVKDDRGRATGALSACVEGQVTSAGYRLLWYCGKRVVRSAGTLRAHAVHALLRRVFVEVRRFGFADRNAPPWRQTISRETVGRSNTRLACRHSTRYGTCQHSAWHTRRAACRFSAA